MRKITIGLLMLLLAPAGVRAQRAVAVSPSPMAVSPSSTAPEAWNQQDPADSLYRAARAAMNRGEHRRAAELFHQIWQRHARSTYAPDALYWEAFNRYRLDEREELQRAVELLQVQEERYAQASTLRNGDARSLRTRIQGILARRGDEGAARAVMEAAHAVAGVEAAMSGDLARAMARAEHGGVAIRHEALAERLEAVGARHEALAGRLGRVDTDGLPQECREEAELQLAALNALIHMNADRAVPVLQQVMQRRDPCAVVLRRRAVFLLADKETPEAVDMLLEAANNDPDLEVRRQAVFWLSEVEDERAVSALARFVMESEDDQVRERAIFALSQHESPQAMQVVRRVARDTAMPTRLRERAIFWLAEEGSREDVESLKAMFDQVRDPRLAERILFAVGQTENSADAEWLMAVAADSTRDIELRARAVFWAAEAGVSVAALGRLYDRVQIRQLKERIIFGLSESDQPGAIEKLIEIARTEDDTQLRTRAIFWLGNSNDERAADALLEILANPGGGGDGGGGGNR